MTITLKQLEDAFVKADEAGNTEDAQAFADEIQRLRKTQQPRKGIVAEAVGGILEPVANVLSGMAAKPIGDAAGLASLVGNAVGLSDRMPADVQTQVRNALTYHPQTAAGKAITESEFNPVNILGNAVGSGSKAIADVVRGDDPGILRSMAGDAVQEAIPQALNVLGAAPSMRVGVPSPPVPKAIEHLFESPSTRAGRFLNDAAGPLKEQYKLKLRQKLQEIVPGAPRFAAESVNDLGRAEFASLTDSSMNRFAPSARDAVNSARNTAYVDQLRSIGGRGAGDTAIEAAKAARTAVTEPLYKAAEASTSRVSAMPVFQIVEETLKKKGNIDSIAIPLDNIKNKLVVKTNRGMMLEHRPAQLIAISDDISRKIAEKSPGGGPAYDVKVLTGIKDALDEQIGKVVPEYKQADATYAQMSPNAMEIGARLEDKLVPALGQEAGIAKTSFANAVRDEAKTIKDATGFKRAQGFEQYFDPKPVYGIMDDLGSRELNQRMASSGRESMARIIGKSVSELDLPPTLTHVGMAARWANKLVGRNKSDAALKMIAEAGTDPAKMANLMDKANPATRRELARILINPNILMTVPSEAR